MASSTTNARPVAGPGARNLDLLGSISSFETNAFTLRVQRLRGRFPISAALAFIIADLAYQTTGRRA
jgi:hypothetical protein